MQGYGHAISTAAGATALVGAGVIPLSLHSAPAFVLAAAGAALLPDADHPNATFAHSLPPITKIIATAIGKVSGGHRHVTHSAIGVGIIAVASFLANQVTFGGYQIGSALIMLLLAALAMKSLKLVRGWATAWAAAGAGALVCAISAPEVNWWLPLATVLGCVSHIIGDALTTQGINPVSPFTLRPAVASAMWKKNGYMAVPVLGNAGSAREVALCAVLVAYLIDAWVAMATGSHLAPAMWQTLSGVLA